MDNSYQLLKLILQGTDASLGKEGRNTQKVIFLFFGYCVNLSGNDKDLLSLGQS